MSYGECFHEETRVIDGTSYYITKSYDRDSVPPWDDSYGDTGYGKLLTHADRLDRYDDEDWAAWAEDWEFSLDATRVMEVVAQHKMARLLLRGRHHRDENLYFDVWETLKQAREENWGPDPETAVDKVYAHMLGWYNDDWHFIGIEVTNKTTGKRESLWGIESNDENYHEEVIADLIAQTQPKPINLTTT